MLIALCAVYCPLTALLLIEQEKRDAQVLEHRTRP